MRPIAIAALVLLLALYLWGAARQATLVNTDVHRGDQGGYLRSVARLRASSYHDLGDRNRMPLYPALQSLFYSPAASADASFERAKWVNLILSVLLIAALVPMLRAWLPWPHAILIALTAALTVFMFKAGWVQAELLFYVLSFAAWLVLLGLLLEPSPRMGLLGGLLCGLAYLTKATILPAILFWIVWSAAVSAYDRLAGRPARAFARMASTGAVLVLALAVTAPYLAQNKRIYGHWLYNVNTTFAVWCDSWEEFKEGPRAHGAMAGWPDLPEDETPSLSRYLRTHTFGQIASRLAHGSRVVVTRASHSYGYFQYAVLCGLLAGFLMLRNRPWALDLLKRHAPAAGFLAGYFVLSFLSIAWYVPIAAGNRFILAIFLPFLFVCMLIVARAPATKLGRWSIAPLAVAVIYLLLLIDIPLRLLPQTALISGGH